MQKRYSFIRGMHSLSNISLCRNALHVVLLPARELTIRWYLRYAIVLRLNLEIAYNVLIARRFCVPGERRFRARKAPNVVSTKTSVKSLATAALFSITAFIAGCGGGGATDPFAVPPVVVIPPLVVTPSALNIYAGTPVAITINSGVGPFQVFTSDAVVLPVAQMVSGAAITLTASNVAVDAPVTITIRDAASQSTTVAVTVKTSPLLGALSITPTSNTTCAGATASVLDKAAICSGESGLASITVRSTNTAVLPNRQIRFDVVQGNYNFLINQTGTILAKTYTLTTDQNGRADVVIRTDPGVPSGAALIRVTDLTSGNRVDSAFTIVQATSGAATLSVVPPNYSGGGGFTQQCVSIAGEYVIYGGTAPYTVTNGLPNAGTLTSGASSGQVIVVTNQGGIFRFTSNAVADGCGGFIVPLTIADATGRITTVTFTVTAGTTARAPAVLSPASVSFAANQGGSAGVAEIKTIPASCSDNTTPFADGCAPAIYVAASCTPSGTPNNVNATCPGTATYAPPTCSNNRFTDANRTNCVQPVFTPATAGRPAIAAVPNTQCSERSVVYTINGGVTPYTISSSLIGVMPGTATVLSSPSNFTLTFPALNVGVVVTITAVDAKGALFTSTVTCAAGA